MAQWRKTFFSLGGPEFIADPRADEAARLAQIALQSRAQRMAEEVQARQLAEEQRQFDAQLGQRALFQRDESARRAEELGWQQQQAERAFQAEQADRLFARNRATGADALAREQALAQQAEAARRAALDERRFGLDERELAERVAARESAQRQAATQYEQSRQDDALKYAAAHLDRMLREKRLDQEKADAPAKAAAERAAEVASRKDLFDYEHKKRMESEAAQTKAQNERNDQIRQQQEGERAKELEALLAQEAAKVASYGSDLFRRTTEKVGATNNFYKNLGPLGRGDWFPASGWTSVLPIGGGKFTAPYKDLTDLLGVVNEAFSPKPVVGQDPAPAPATGQQVQAVRLALTAQIKNYFNGIRARVGTDPEIDQAEAELLARVDELAAGSPYARVGDAVPKTYATRPSMALR